MWIQNEITAGYIVVTFGHGRGHGVAAHLCGMCDDGLRVLQPFATHRRLRVTLICGAFHGLASSRSAVYNSAIVKREFTIILGMKRKCRIRRGAL